jgi:hypothetical protein
MLDWNSPCQLCWYLRVSCTCKFAYYAVNNNFGWILSSLVSNLASCGFSLHFCFCNDAARLQLVCGGCSDGSYLHLALVGNNLFVLQCRSNFISQTLLAGDKLRELNTSSLGRYLSQKKQQAKTFLRHAKLPILAKTSGACEK